MQFLFRGERGFDFAIRTPCTPSRWNEFDTEMAMAWEVSNELLCTPDIYAYVSRAPYVLMICFYHV